MTQEELKEILREHKKWLNGKGGCKADFSWADLRKADLRKATFRGADFNHADLRGAILRGADFNGADLHGATLCWADLRGVDFSEADLRDADLREADLRKADLRWANFREASLSRASLQGAVLRGAKLNGADLQRADGILKASCEWTSKGGRCTRLLAVYIGDAPDYFYGCFSGSEKALRRYIKNHSCPIAKKRLIIAADFVAARMAEMIKDKQQRIKHENDKPVCDNEPQGCDN